MTGLYLHIPFCLRKCPYCDFFSVPTQGAAVADYVRSLASDLQQAASHWPGPISTLFFGGGTPSLLSPDEVAGLLDQITQQYGMTANAEISLEANPGTLDPEKLAGYRQAGINRLSIGLQSLDDNRLRQLGRLHDAATGLQALHDARAAGFVTGSTMAFWNWLYDLHAIRAGFLIVHLRPFANGLGAEATAADYAPIYFGTFGACYGLAIYLGQHLFLTEGRWELYWPLFITSNLLTLAIPTLLYMLSSYLKYGDPGIRPVH